jgi:DNA-binding NarL/FixJ family response regulator
LVDLKTPDLVLMDLKMPVMNGIQATRKLRERYPEMHVLVLTTYADDEWLFDAIRSGASGYLLKDRPRMELIEAIKGTVAGDSYIDPAVAPKVLANVAQAPPPKSLSPKISLSPRETEILELLTLGLSNADIAQRLFLSEGTVRNYMSTLFSKLEVSDRTQAVVVALRYGLVDIGKL